MQMQYVTMSTFASSVTSVLTTRTVRRTYLKHFTPYLAVKYEGRQEYIKLPKPTTHTYITLHGLQNHPNPSLIFHNRRFVSKKLRM
jgi:hypothetical protein